MDVTADRKSKVQKKSGLPFLTAEDILNVGKSCTKEESPINLSFDIMKEIRLSPLEWENFGVTPKLMKISNSGTTAILSGKWYGPRPYLANGPVSGKYVFSQMHFHWGRTFQEGSEHRVNGESLPLEAHAMFFKNVYFSQDDAMKRTDGIVTMAYFFNLQEEDNDNLIPITEVLPDIAVPLTSQHITTVALKQFIPPFSNDYFLYWGNVVNMSVLWFICRKPLGISPRQLSLFQKLIGSDKKLIEKNFREPRDLNHRVVFHVNPSDNKAHPLLPIREEDKKKKTNFLQKVYSFTTIGENTQPLYTVAEQEEKRKTVHKENAEFVPENKGKSLCTGDNEEKKDSMTDLLNFSLKRKPNVKELKYTLAKILLELEKKENNDDFGVLENYIKAKYAATHERLIKERSVLKANELPTKQQSSNLVARIDSADILKKPGDSLFKKTLNLEEGTFYENSMVDVKETDSNFPQKEEGYLHVNKVHCSTTDFQNIKDTFEEVDKASQERLSLEDKGRFSNTKRICKSASEEGGLTVISPTCFDKSAFDSPDVLRSRRARFMIGKNQSAQRIRERSGELVTFTTSCEVQETLTILETTKSDNYSLMNSDIVSTDSESAKPFSGQVSSSGEGVREETSNRKKKSLNDLDIAALKEKIKTRRLKSKVTLAQLEDVKEQQTSIGKTLVEKKEQELKMPQGKNEDECQRRRALIRKSMMRLMKDRPKKENLTPKTPERPAWKP